MEDQIKLKMKNDGKNQIRNNLKSINDIQNKVIEGNYKNSEENQNQNNKSPKIQSSKILLTNKNFIF